MVWMCVECATATCDTCGEEKVMAKYIDGDDMNCWCALCATGTPPLPAEEEEDWTCSDCGEDCGDELGTIPGEAGQWCATCFKNH